jgi:hypothetical protein
MARPLAHEWRAKAAIWPAKANRQLASSTYAGAFRIAELVRTDVDRRDDRLPGQLPGSRGPCRHDRGAIAASVAEHAGRDQAPRGRPRRDGELEGLQPRLPGPAQRAPSAPWLPLNRTSLVVSAHHRADSSGSGLGIFPIGDSRAFKAETGFPPHSRKRRPPLCGRQKEAGGEGASESALISERAFTPRDSAKSPASVHRPSGARRYEGWPGTRACLFRSKACHYAPLCNDALRRDEAPPHHPPPVALTMASITSVASAVLGRRSRSQLSRLASIAKISVEAIKSLKPKNADAMRITAVLRYTASSIYLPLWSSPF